MNKTTHFTSKPLDFGPESFRVTFLEFLIKYPKDATHLHFSESILKSKQFLHRIKQLKGIKSLHFIKSNHMHTKLLREAFKSQRLRIKNFSGLNESLIPQFPNIKDYSVDIPDMDRWLTFTSLCQIRELTINICPELEHLEQESACYKARRRRFWLHLCGLKNLRRLQVNCQDYKQLTIDVFTELNRLPELLEPLHSLVLNVSFANSSLISPKDFDYKNILKYTTKIELHDTMIPASHYLLDQIDRCGNLKALSAENIRFGKLSEYLKGYNTSINFQPFRSISSLSMLRLLDIAIVLSSGEQFEIFTSLFALPDSIESVRLVLQRVRWSQILEEGAAIELKKENPFLRNAKCIDFYNKWKSIKSLKSLTLKFELTETDQPIPTAYFVIPLLKNLSTLTELDYMNNISWNTHEIGPLNLQDLWSAIENSRQTLRKLWIEDKIISLRGFQENPEEWPKLKDLIITGAVEDEGFGHLMNLFKGSGETGRRRVGCLSLKELVIGKDEGFGECLKALSKKPKDLYTKLYMNVENVSPETIVEKICKFVEKSEVGMTVLLNLLNARKIGNEELKKLDECIGEKRVFRNLKITMRNPFGVYDYVKRVEMKKWV